MRTRVETNIASTDAAIASTTKLGSRGRSRYLQVTRAVAERMGIEFPAHHEIKELEQHVEPGRVLDTLERESKFKQGFHP
jgi:hypothetical protein